MMTAFAWLVGGAGAVPPPGDEASWKEVRNDEVRVECTEVEGEPWCRAHGVVDAPIGTVAARLENMSEHQDKFEMVASIATVEPDTLHITIDYPSPLSDRDYVARYTRSVDGAVRWYRWSPVAHPSAPPVRGVVRLPKFAGHWRLEPSGARTQVTYQWHAEVGGSIPKWVATTARKRAGHHALEDLAIASGSALVEPQ